MGVVLDEGERLGPSFAWREIVADERVLGHMTNGVWSYRLRKNIGFALVASGCTAGDAVQVRMDTTTQPGRLVELPFL